jgi:hypothetical protein
MAGTVPGGESRLTAVVADDFAGAFVDVLANVIVPAARVAWRISLEGFHAT